MERAYSPCVKVAHNLVFEIKEFFFACRRLQLDILTHMHYMTLLAVNTTTMRLELQTMCKSSQFLNENLLLTQNQRLYTYSTETVKLWRTFSRVISFVKIL